MRSADPESTTRGCPLRRKMDISRANLWRNEEAPFPQGLGAVFKGVLRKKHAGQTTLEPVISGTPTSVIRLIISCSYVDFRMQSKVAIVRWPTYEYHRTHQTIREIGQTLANVLQAQRLFPRHPQNRGKAQKPTYLRLLPVFGCKPGRLSSPRRPVAGNTYKPPTPRRSISRLTDLGTRPPGLAARSHHYAAKTTKCNGRCPCRRSRQSCARTRRRSSRRPTSHCATSCPRRAPAVRRWQTAARRSP